MVETPNEWPRAEAAPPPTAEELAQRNAADFLDAEQALLAANAQKEQAESAVNAAQEKAKVAMRNLAATVSSAHPVSIFEVEERARRVLVRWVGGPDGTVDVQAVEPNVPAPEPEPAPQGATAPAIGEAS